MRRAVTGLIVAAALALGSITVAVADPYPGTVGTVADADGARKVHRGKKPTTKVRVRAAGNAKPVGRLKVTYSRVDGGFRATKTVKYSGKSVSFKGPRVKKRGKYKVLVRFDPKPESVFKKSRDSYRFKVVK